MNSYDNYKLVVIPVEQVQPDQAENLFKFFNERKKEMMVQAFGYENKTYAFRIFEAFKGLNTERLMSLLETAIKAFTMYNVNPLTTCVFCNEDNTDKKTRVNKIAFPAHSHCISNAKKEVEDIKNEYDNSPSNNSRGFLGAIIGAVIGAIPWVVVEIITGYYASILAVIIGFSAFFFYKKLGGKVEKNTKVTILSLSFVMIIIANIVIAGFYLISWGYAFSLENIIILYTNPETSGAFLGDIAISLLIGGVGLISVFKKIQSEEINRVAATIE
jgi:hypothetical protein